MNILDLKNYIKDLPDDMEICTIQESNNQNDNGFITANFDEMCIRNHEYDLDYATDSNFKSLTANKEFLFLGF